MVLEYIGLFGEMKMEHIIEKDFLDILRNCQKFYPENYLKQFVSGLRKQGVLDRQIVIFSHQYRKLDYISQEELDDILNLLK